MNRDYLNKKYVMAVGNFDGMHIGHQCVFEKLHHHMQSSSGLCSAFVTFEPHPRHFLGKPFERLLSLRDKRMLAKRFGFDRFFVIRFNEKVRTLTADEFLEKLLNLGMHALVVGQDFHFGYKKQGNINYLKTQEKTKNFKLLIAPDVVKDERVSSSLIRRLLKAHLFEKVNALLGYRYGITARVMRGKQKGRLLGVPTLNLNLASNVFVLFGVYAVRVQVAGKWYCGVCNAGYAPTFGLHQYRIEVHAYDCVLPVLYGKLVRVEFYAYLRDAHRFKDVNALKTQLLADIKNARSFFKQQA